MKVVYFTSRTPYPPYKGDQLIAYEQIKKLSALNVQVYLICFADNDEDEHHVRTVLNKYCREVYTFKIKRWQKPLNLLKVFFNFKPFQVNLYTNNKLKIQIRKLCHKINPDLIHIQTVRIAEYFMEDTKPKVIDMIDVLSLNMKRRAEKESILLKLILNIESKLLANYEKKVLNVYDKTMLVSENDKKYLNNNNININPNGTNIDKKYLEKYKDIKKKKILIFHGNMNYFPNIEAMTIFSKQIWPEINKKYPDYRLYIVGKDPVKKIRDLNGKNNIVVTGFVEDICQYLCEGSIGIYPMYSGTGMQNKIVEALACGLPIVATPIALQGIKDISDNELILGSDKKEVLNGIEQLIQHKNLRERLSGNGQRFVFNNYSWDKNVYNLINIWKETIKKKAISQ